MWKSIKKKSGWNTVKTTDSTVVMGEKTHKLLIPADELHEAITKYLHNNPPIPAQSSAWDVADQIVKSLSHFRYP